MLFQQSRKFHIGSCGSAFVKFMPAYPGIYIFIWLNQAAAFKRLLHSQQ